MAEILVPIISEGISSLYKVEANLKTNETEVITLCNRIKGQASEGVDCIIDKLHDYFNKEINITIGLRNIETGVLLKADSISLDTQSITLGVLTKTIELVENRIFQKNYDYIILTGNYKDRKLISVSDIEKKYTAVKKNADNNKSKKYLFLFICDDKFNFCRVGWNNNVYVKQFRTNTPFNFIYPELFILDSKKYQSCGLSKIKEPLNIDLTGNNSFQNIKAQFINQEVHNGILIYGPKGSLKNVFAFQLCEFLLASQIIEIPIWGDFSGFNNTNEWIENTISNYLSGTYYGLKDLSNKTIVTVIANILPTEFENCLHLITNYFEKNKIKSLLIITSISEPSDEKFLLKYNIKSFAVKRDYLYVLKKNRFFVGIITLLLLIILAYIIYAYKEFSFNYSNITITQNGFCGRKITNDVNPYVYKFTYRKGKLIKIDFINKAFKKNTTTDLYDLISFSTIKLDYLNGKEVTRIKFYDENGFFIASYQIEKDFNNIRLNLNNIGATPLIQFYYPDNKESQYKVQNNRSDLLRINSVLLSFNTETGKLDEINFYKTHNSFEIVTNAYGICGVKFIYDSNDLLMEEQFISSNNQLESIYKIQFQYDDYSNLCEVSYLDIEGNLINNQRGWAIKKDYYSNNQLLTEYNDFENLPVLSVMFKYDGNKLEILKYGNTIFKNFEYNRKHNLISFLIQNSYEQTIKCKYESENGKLIKQAFLYNDQYVIQQQEKYSYTLYKYGKDKVEQKFYDDKEEECDNKNSISGIFITLDSEGTILKQELSSKILKKLKQN